MQKTSPTKINLIQRAKRLFQRSAKPSKLKPTDVPDYLRRDIGLPPAEPSRRRTSDPPERDPFRLL